METTAPTYLEALKKSEAYSDSPQKIKFEETQGSYLFHADAQLYKIKKTGNEFASLAVKEVFCREECRLLMHYNPEWTAEVVTLNRTESSYRLARKEGEIEEYVLKMENLPDRRFLSSLIKKKNAGPADLSLAAVQLASIHADSGMSVREGETGKAERFQALCDDMLYQMKRYFDPSITQPIIDMIRHPLDKFIHSKSNVFGKRLRKGRVVQGHGALLPEHIHIQGETVRFLSPHEVYKKYSVLDAAHDVATLMVELIVANEKELADHFLQKYKEASKDKDLESILPAYQTYCALKHGVLTCERKVALQDESLGPVALEYFNLATRFSRTISKD